MYEKLKVEFQRKNKHRNNLDWSNFNKNTWSYYGRGLTKVTGFEIGCLISLALMLILDQ
jgi:hypothetical protein